VLVAPVLEKGARRRDVWLPPGAWTHWLTGQVCDGGQPFTVDAPLGLTPMFVREGTALWVAEPGHNAEATLRNPMSLEVYPPSPGTVGGGSLFLDDGESDLAARFILDASLRLDGQALRISLSRREQSFMTSQHEFELVLPSSYRAVSVDGRSIELQGREARVNQRSGACVFARVSLAATEIIGT